MIQIDQVNLLFYTIAIGLALLFLYIAFYQTQTKKQKLQEPPKQPPAHQNATQKETLSRLIDIGATLYGANWCGYTTKQLDELGLAQSDLKGLDYVECTTSEQLCREKSIQAFPTWQINGQIYPGFYKVDQLEQLIAK